MKLSTTVLATATGLLGAWSAAAQSNEALLNKLVEKGILTTDEARQLKAESEPGTATAFTTKAGMPPWVTTFKLGGDFRGRFDDILADNQADVDRLRWRYRIRFGFVATLQDDFEVGFRLASGDVDSALSAGASPLSPNQTLQNNGSKKGILVDQVYGRWMPLHTGDWQGDVAFGKLPEPFVFSEIGLGIDPDYSPEGGALQLQYEVRRGQTLRWINGGFVLDEISLSSHDPFLFGSQLRWESQWAPQWSSSLGLMVFSFANVDELSNGAVPNMNVGNWRVLPTGSLSAAAAVPQFKFNPVLADAAITWRAAHVPGYAGPFPVTLVGTYLNNPAAPASAGNYGWSAGVVLGRAGKKGTWELSYEYKWLGANAIWEEVVDDDFGGYWASTSGLNFGANDAPGYYTGTNVRGHIVKLAYSPYDCLTLSLKWYLTGLIDVPPVSGTVDPESLINRVQVDALWRF